MGKLFRGAGWYLEVRGREHYPAHFHVVGTDFAALVDMITLTVIEGEIPRSVRIEAFRWAEANRDRLMEEWHRMNPDLPIRF